MYAHRSFWSWQVEIMFPDWFLSLFFAALSANFFRLRRIPESSAAVCAACGYDLRATPDRCPECGTAARDMEPARL
jgi:hypothetical protein